MNQISGTCENYSSSYSGINEVMANSTHPAHTHEHVHEPFGTLNCDQKFVLSKPQSSTRIQAILRPYHRYDDFVSAGDTINDQALSGQIALGKLCSTCRQFQDWFRSNRNAICSGHSEMTWRQHHLNTAALKQFSESGCHLCTLIWHSIFETSNVTCIPEPDHDGKRPYKYIDENRWSVVRDKQVSIRVVRGRSYNICFRDMYKLIPLGLLTSVDTGDNGMGGYIEINYHQESASALNAQNSMSIDFTDWHGYHSTIAVCTASNPSLNKVAGWVQDCVKNHIKCANRAVTCLPTRILDVGQLDDANQEHQFVQLVSTSKWQHIDTVQYAALSYCWGGDGGFKLTSGTMDALQRGIGANELPRTIQHAVQVARFLRIRYLWVDSLCIIQNSPKDWATESANMCDVYAGAFITIAAIDSLTSNDGLFAQRDPLLYSACLLCDIDGESQAYAVPTKTVHTDLQKTWPLHRRGWVVQERILSRRTIGFGQCLRWDCRETSRSEFALPNKSRYDPLSCGSFFSSVLDTGNCQYGQRASEGKVFAIWEIIFCNFSECSLAVKSDRMAALSGIVIAIQRRTLWKFFAGVWEPFLLRGLLWYTNDKDSEPTEIGPSWSWINITGRVFTPLTGDTQNWEELAAVAFQNEQQSLETIARDTLHTSPQLIVTCVALKVGGLILKKSSIDHTIANHCKLAISADAYPPYDMEFKLLPDSRTRTTTPTKLLLMARDGNQTYAIAAEPFEDGTYKRIGFVNLDTYSLSSNDKAEKWVNRIIEKGQRQTFRLI